MSGVQRIKWQIVCATLVALVAGSLWAQVLPPAKSAGDVSSRAADQKATDQKNDPGLSSALLDLKFSEDWSTPSLKGSNLGTIDPMVGQVDQYPDYTFEITRVQWRPADPIDLYIMKPAGVKKPPVILYLYSYPYNNDRYQKSEFRKFLTRNGFAAVGFVGALTAERFRSGRGLTEWFVSDLREALATSAHDVQMILAYLSTRGDLDMDHVGMFGEGSGASIAILAAASDPRIKTLDLVNPWGDWTDWLAKSTLVPEKERPRFLKQDFLAGVANLDPLKWLPELKTQKIRLQEVKSVTVTPSEARQKLEAAAPSNVEVVRYEDAKAFATTVSTGILFDWLKLRMQEGKTQEYRAADRSQAKGSPNEGKQSQH